MPQTYTTQFFDVSDGDTTTHNPQSLAPTTADIQILNAEILWEGVATSSTSTSTRSNTNSDTATATRSTNRTTRSNTNSDTATATSTTTTKSNSNSGSDSGTDGLASATYPSVPSGASFTKHELEVTVANFADTIKDIEYAYTDSNFNTENGSTTLDPNEPKTVVDFATSTNFVGETPSFTVTSVSGGNADQITYGIDSFTKGEETTVESATASASYPSVPSGFSFDKHVVKKFENGSRVNKSTFFSQQSGSESITSNDPNDTVKVKIKTVGEGTTTTLTDTRNPSVSGDVSASYTSGDITDGVTTNFISLSGLTADPETFEHTIGGSGEARFRFRFSFEKILPDPTNGTVAFADTSKGVFHEVAVADPTDSALDYNHVQIYNESTGNWGALDVVNVTDADALEQFAFYDSDAGWLAPRAQSTTPI